LRKKVRLAKQNGLGSVVDFAGTATERSDAGARGKRS
jgi:hypothetical protein